MQTFRVVFRSFEDVREFVSASMTQRFDITVGSGAYRVDAKSLMIMFSLDYSRPLEVRADCSEAECAEFLEKTARFRVHEIWL